MRIRPKTLPLIKRFLQEIPNNHNPALHLGHKKTWIDLVENGTWPCSPDMLHTKIINLTRVEEYQPRGEKLLRLRSRDKLPQLFLLL